MNLCGLSTPQQKLAKKLTQLPCFKAFKVTDIKVIATGLSQPCFCVGYNNNVYFAKYLNSNSIEAVAAQLAANQGISPHLIYVGHNWLITRFVEGEVLNTAIQSEDEKLAIMLTLLSKCHRIDYQHQHPKKIEAQEQNTKNLVTSKQGFTSTHEVISGVQNTTEVKIHRLDILGTISRLLASLNCKEPLMKRLLVLFSELRGNLTHATHNMTNIQWVLCHGDANFTNVIRVKKSQKNTTASYQLIDFECACIAPREYDFAMLLAVNELARDKIPSINSLYNQSQSSYIKPNNSTKIVDNLAQNIQCPSKLSIPLVTCYHDLSILVNYLWYLGKYMDIKQEKYNILAKAQLKLLSAYHLPAKSILDEMR